MGVWYCTREDVKSALDSAETARNNAQVDRAINGASGSVEGQLNRRFYPWTGTRSFPWPNQQYARPWRLWLDFDELISVTSIVTGGTTLTVGTDVFLEPVNTGPPYTHLEINLASRAAFDVGATYQRNIAITGVYGFNLDEDPAGALAAAIVSTTAIRADVTDSSSIGVGSILRVDTERMIVTGKSLLTTGQTLQADLAALNSGDQVSVSDGTKFFTGETITVGSERMLIVDIAGNTLIVKRAWDGSVLATHSGATIYAPRTLTVARGALGTTAATHLIAAPVAKHAVPGLVRDLGIAESLVRLGVETAQYTRTQTRGQNGKPISSELEDIRARAFDAYGRKVRARAV